VAEAKNQAAVAAQSHPPAKQAAKKESGRRAARSRKIGTTSRPTPPLFGTEHLIAPVRRITSLKPAHNDHDQGDRRSEEKGQAKQGRNEVIHGDA